MLKSAEYRAYADWAYESLKMFEDEKNGGVYWSVTFDGRPADTTKHTYCQAFAIYGLSAYYRLTGKREALEKARELFRIIEEKCRVYNGYGEAYQADFSPESNEKLSENGVMATRTMNTLLHVLEAYTELHRAEPEEHVRQASVKALERFLHTMYNPEKHRLEVFYDDDYRPLLDMQSYGHDIESGWLLWDSVQEFLPEKERAPYRAMCLDLLESVRRRAFTDHGLKNEWVAGETNELRIWWVQAETMLGLDCGWHLTGDPSWKEDLETQWKTIQRMIVDPRPGGEWYWSVYEDGSLTERPMVEEWKCPYHNGRMCMRLMERKEV
jgi:mannobiose 2-epimerase